MNTHYIIDNQEIYDDNAEKYDTVLIYDKMNNRKNSGKHNMYCEEIETVKNDKNIMSRKRDSRYSFKNRRTVNKYWKDFNNNQM